MRASHLWKASGWRLACSCCIVFLLTSPLFSFVSSEFSRKATLRASEEFGANVHITTHIFTRPLACPGAADTSIAECNALLTTTAGYTVANDITEQRNALIEFYNSTGGNQWSKIASGTALRDQVDYYVNYLITIGTLAQQPGFSAAALPAESQQLYYAVAQLSVDCRVQASFCTAPQCCCPDCDQHAVSQHEPQIADTDHAVSTAHTSVGETAGQVAMGYQW